MLVFFLLMLNVPHLSGLLFVSNDSTYGFDLTLKHFCCRLMPLFLGCWMSCKLVAHHVHAFDLFADMLTWRSTEQQITLSTLIRCLMIRCIYCYQLTIKKLVDFIAITGAPQTCPAPLSQKIFMKSKAINFDPFDIQLPSELLKNIF